MAERESLVKLDAARSSAEKAYEMAGVTPSDISFVELHDAYTIMNALSLEALGFAKPGEGVGLAVDNEITLTGSIPICTFGGLKARGHPIGATGCYQVVESYLQLTGQAADNQVEDAQVAMTQSFGGTASAVYTHILEAA